MKILLMRILVLGHIDTWSNLLAKLRIYVPMVLPLELYFWSCMFNRSLSDDPFCRWQLLFRTAAHAACWNCLPVSGALSGKDATWPPAVSKDHRLYEIEMPDLEPLWLPDSAAFCCQTALQDTFTGSLTSSADFALDILDGTYFDACLPGV